MVTEYLQVEIFSNNKVVDTGSSTFFAFRGSATLFSQIAVNYCLAVGSALFSIYKSPRCNVECCMSVTLLVSTGDDMGGFSDGEAAYESDAPGTTSDVTATVGDGDIMDSLSDEEIALESNAPQTTSDVMTNETDGDVMNGLSDEKPISHESNTPGRTSDVMAWRAGGDVMGWFIDVESTDKRNAPGHTGDDKAEMNYMYKGNENIGKTYSKDRIS